MNLNSLSPEPGSRRPKKRLGRGIGSGLGKTSGKGHKGQKARAGGYHKINFEGGQMPIQRRLPKMGFKSRVGRTVDQVCLSELEQLSVDVIDLNVLKDAGIVSRSIKDVKVILSGELTTAIKLKGLRVTKGARATIEGLGGSVEE
ncbi:50S ribosomal protein L15 [Legionella longbeachae]|uniref:Large ribosomal subunit protein uL15 n=1 Tax=Legionella longbeachae serogroup 1 (strain NSW150) TaxID=661367 RepID=D3HPM2_LEGLN|nr:50S ribosomal protein L15 [Legionella longbeachae]VEE01359.1 50S ribosomal protein L15 [Legionella oakridgensis]HBD7396076.1 50S ribosomal protein L15 [Legionella pneumophila]ARB92277.1 50S ribosomal protein L15 [Legionella longbeachae]ARM34542.1 50S ribosomal protein L15 [Legionella longbeachae]EEZ96170.1 ribosomal protein L15 [Legionella longbeachae D-4968]